MVERKSDSYYYNLVRGNIRKYRLEKNFTLENIKSNKFNSRIVCKDVELIYQESPKAYKKIEDVIESLVEFELVTVIATFKPVLTFKG